MSKTFGKLFGSPSEQYQSSSSPTAYGSLSPQAQTTYNNALQGAQGLTAQNFSPAAFTPQQTQAANYFSTPVSAITPEQFQSGISTFSNPFEEQVLQNTIGDLNTQAQGSYGDIASFASDIGGFGSNRRGLLESELQKNLLKTVGDISASSRAANFENAANRTLTDIGQVRQMNQQNMGSLFDIGTQFQNSNTATQNAPAQLQQYLTSLATMLQGGGNSSSGVSYGADPGMVSRLNTGAGNLSSLAAGGAALMSDMRVKQDIRLIGKDKGFNIYEFAYKFIPEKKFKGVMAQEVQRTRPDAISELFGFLAVDYNKIGLRMEAI